MIVERGFAIVFVSLLACSGGGQSPPAIECDHTQFQDSQCCTSNTDCTAPNGVFCAPPGADIGCGFCSQDPGTCAVDADCKAQSPSAICEPRECACEGQRECVGGCTSNAQCATGQSCELASSRCVATSCSVAADCPVNFGCNGSCARKTCSDNSQCDGFCVDGQCFDSAGECRLPAA
jgi:hypothetical protein